MLTLASPPLNTRLLMATEIEYSEKYEDDVYEYRHVILPRDIAKRLPKPPRLLTESEWRSLGVTQSRGWSTRSTPPQPPVAIVLAHLHSLTIPPLSLHHTALSCPSA